MADVGVAAAASPVPSFHQASARSSTQSHPSRTPSQSEKSSKPETPSECENASRTAREPEPTSSAERSSAVSLSAPSLADSRASQPISSFPAFPSSLDYASVRDFAYAADDPKHYGIAPTPSGATTPASDRRVSDPLEQFRHGLGRYSAGQWGGDGVIYGDPDADMEPLPSTAFGGEPGDSFDDAARQKHRKSRSYADITDFDRRGSNNRRSKDSDRLRYSNSQHDPAGRDGLRLSRGFSNTSESAYRRDSHRGATSSAAPPLSNDDPDARMPLDEEISYSHAGPRASLSPEDESVRGQALALYDFEPENPNELRLREGQTVNVAYRNGHGWLVAEDPDTREQGLVPEEYVRLVRDIEGWDPERGGFFEEVDGEGEDGETEDFTTGTDGSEDVTGGSAKEGS